MPELTCFRLLDAESPAGPLAEAVRQVNTGQTGAAVFTLDPVSFKQVPNAPFAYWVEEKVRRLFKDLPAFESANRTARVGLQTGDDFRFVRCWWEVSAQNADSLKRSWWPFAKGGAFSPYYADLHLVVNFQDNGAELRCCDAARVQNDSFFFRPGLTWSTRSQIGFSIRLLPAGCVFAHMGPSAFVNKPEDAFAYLALLNAACTKALIDIIVPVHSYETGAIQRTPIPGAASPDELNQLGRLASKLWASKRSFDTVQEVSHVFVCPWVGALPAALSICETSLTQTHATLLSDESEKQAIVDCVTEELFGFKVPEVGSVADTEEQPADVDEDASGRLDAARMLVSYLFGVAFGRWAIPDNPGELRKPPADPFAPLPDQAPGAASAEAAKLCFAEDASGESPLLNGCRAALRQATSLDSVDAYEQDLAARLGVPTLRDYLSRPAGFFADHLSVYSKSRRKAPIYWPLSTKSGNFTLWVYYPKMDDQALPKLVADVLSPKIRTLTQEIENRRGTPGGKVAELEALRQELEEMRTDFLDLINRGYRPNQNDGVLITACPLAKYFRHAGFRKNLEACWKELARGDYDWAHLAMAMWPDRALEACKTDRSIAIAHGREDLCPAEPPKAARGRKKTPPPT